MRDLIQQKTSLKTKNNTLYIPSRNVISKDGKKYVQVLVDQNLNSDRFANLTIVSQEDNQKIFEV